MDATEDVNVRCTIKKQTPLHIAASKCHHNALKVLLSNLKTDIWAKDSEARTALHWVADSCKFCLFHRFPVLLTMYL